MGRESFDARSVMSDAALKELTRIVRIVMEAHEKSVREERENALTNKTKRKQK